MTKIADAEKGSELGRNVDVSPDGEWILYTQMDQINSDIMLVENFR